MNHGISLSVYNVDIKQVNPFQPSVAFHMETSHLKCNTGLKRVNPVKLFLPECFKSDYQSDY